VETKENGVILGSKEKLGSEAREGREGLRVVMVKKGTQGTRDMQATRGHQEQMEPLVLQEQVLQA
jgi:hypothetical protein